MALAFCAIAFQLGVFLVGSIAVIAGLAGIIAVIVLVALLHVISPC